MNVNRISRPWFLALVGGVVLTSLVVALAPQSSAQAKKGEKTEAKAEKKSKGEMPPTNFPKRLDSIDPAQGGVQHVTMIDDAILDGWKNNKTFPSERCTDYEFIRRASLDIIGRIPTVGEINQFMKHPPEKRRSWVINEMLDGKDYGYGDEYAQNFANLWTVNLLTRTGSAEHAQNQMNDWLRNHFKGDEKASSPISPDWSKVVAGLISAKGSTNEDNAANYLLHNLGEENKTTMFKDGRWDMVPATSRTTRLFLGIRTQCVQCHDHPFNGEWKQENFWGINAFYRQIDTPRGRPQMLAVKKVKGLKIVTDFDLTDNLAFNPTKMIGYERRNTVYLFTDPTFLDGKKIPKDFKGTRREALAQFVTASPFLAKSFVNRTWGHFFGKSFTKDAVDDFGDSNPASHPELLDKLAEDWAKSYNHNPKVLIRWICNSQAYGLSSKANKWNDKTDDETLFARMLLKPMTPEQMFESMMIATSDARKSDPAYLAKKLSDKKAWLSKLVVNFGNDEGEEGTFSGTVVQALLLMNGADINAAISDPKDGAVAAIVKKRGSSYASLPIVLDDMFKQVVGRPPTEKEVQTFRRPDVFNFSNRTKTQPTTPQFWTNYYQDVMWALLNSNEFILNH